MIELSRKGDYAIRGMLYLARQNEGDGFVDQGYCVRQSRCHNLFWRKFSRILIKSDWLNRPVERAEDFL